MFVKHRFELEPYTCDLLKDMEPNFGYNGFGEFIFYRTYSRIINSQQEDWADCIIRVINGTFSIRKDWYLRTYIPWDEKKWQLIARKMAVSAFKMEWLPPGRGLWAMGTDFIYERGGMALYNCFSGDTEFYCFDRVSKLRDQVDNLVSVVDINGKSQLAKVKCFGKQKLQKVIFGKANELYSYWYDVTKNHRWILEDGSVTTNLKVGDIIANHKDEEFVVDKIIDEGKEEEVYCVVEPETHSFTLAGGIPTGNCARSDITNDLADDFSWLMDSLMLGVGVGFSPIRNDNMIFKNPKGTFEYIIPDSREGWVDSVKLKLQAYQYGSSMPVFNYNEIRPKGEPIKGFGGIASGPEPLIYFHTQLDEAIDNYMTDNYYDSVMLKMDIANQIGCCIVAGNIRRCFPGSVRNNTSFGMKKISQIRKGDKVQTLNGYKTVNNVFKQGIQKLVTVILENGKEIRCTPNHRFAVLESIEGRYDWVEAQYLSSNDILLLNHEPCKGITDDPQGAYFFGVLNGDGYVSYHPKRTFQISIVFPSNDQGNKSSEKIIQYLDSKNINFNIYKSTNIKYFRLQIFGKDFVKDCLPYKVPKQNPIIPEWIYESSIESRAAYLAGLCDADGSSDKYILCASKYKEFLEEVRIIASSLGIDTKIRTKISTPHSKTGKIYANEHFLCIRGFAAKRLACKLINPLMIKQFLVKSGTTHDIDIPIQFVYDALESNTIDDSTFTEITKVSRQHSIKRNPIHKQLIDLHPNFWMKIIPCRVSEVVDYGDEEETFDIEVEDEHCFFAEGILVHNSAELAHLPVSDPVFKDLKDPDKFPYRISFSWMSNNSVELYTDDDFDQLGEIARRVKINGEPGYFNLRNFPKGRIGKNDHLRPDKSTGTNPCGEILLENREVCNIDETFPTVCQTPEQWYKACKYATLYATTVSLLPTHQPSTNRVVARNRRIGVGLVDFTGWVDRDGLTKVTKYLRKGYQIVRSNARSFNGEAGVPEPIRVTTVKPGGTIPKLAGKTSGVMYPNFHETLRRVRVARNHPIHKLLAESGLPYEADVVSANTDVFEYPILMGPAQPAEEISIWQQAMNLVILQREWADNAVSNTINFRPKWRLTKFISLLYGADNIYNDVRDWLIENVTYSELDAILEQLAKLITEAETSQHKITFTYDNDFELIEARIYQFDPHHEEGAIEPVLAAIAPLTKSVSLLPHSAKGAYPQMPEEGISREEYENRLSRIRPIDWSKLSDSDGIDQKYCDGDICERIDV